MQTDPDASPFNALPVAVILLAGAIMGVEVIFMLARAGFLGATQGGEDWRIFAIQRFAFSGDTLKWMIETGRAPSEHLMRFFTYSFVHVSFTQAVFVCVFVLALGKMAGEVFSAPAIFLIFFGSAFVGALAYGLILNDTRPLIGGFTGAYGLIGSYTFLLWVGYGAVGANQYQAFRLIGLLLGIQLLFGLLFGSSNDWLAEMFGFATGFLLSGVLSPGGWGRLLAQLRKR